VEGSCGYGKISGNSWVDELLAASQKGHSSKELVS
jgi:hypothetical protein